MESLATDLGADIKKDEAKAERLLKSTSDFELLGSGWANARVAEIEAARQHSAVERQVVTASGDAIDLLRNAMEEHYGEGKEATLKIGDAQLGKIALLGDGGMRFVTAAGGAYAITKSGIFRDDGYYLAKGDGQALNQLFDGIDKARKGADGYGELRLETTEGPWFRQTKTSTNLTRDWSTDAYYVSGRTVQNLAADIEDLGSPRNERYIDVKIGEESIGQMKLLGESKAELRLGDHTYEYDMGGGEIRKNGQLIDSKEDAERVKSFAVTVSKYRTILDQMDEHGIPYHQENEVPHLRIVPVSNAFVAMDGGLDLTRDWHRSAQSIREEQRGVTESEPPLEQD